MKFSLALTSSNPPSPLDARSLRLHLSQTDGWNDPPRNRLCKHRKNLFHKSQRDLRTHRSKSLTEKDNIWNCKQFLPKRINERLQKADLRISHSTKYQRACRPQASKFQEKLTLPCHLSQIPKRQQRPQLTKTTTGPLRSVHNPYSTRDQRHRHLQAHINQKRTPRVPACYPPLNLQHRTELNNSSPQNRNSPVITRKHRRRNPRLMTHQKNLQTRKPLTPLLLAALSLLARTARKLTSLQLTFLPCKTCRRQPVRKWRIMKRDWQVLVRAYHVSRNASRQYKMARNQILLRLRRW